MINNEFKKLFATTIKEEPDSYLVNEIFSRFPSLQDLFQTSEEEVRKIRGVGKVKAKQILSAIQLAKFNPIITEERYKITNPKDAFIYLRDMQFLHREEFVCLGLNTKNEVLFREVVFKGSLDASIVHPREVFNRLIRRNCASAIVAHNHPSGDPTPSKEDIEVTKRLVGVGKIIGIEVLDHLIIGHEKYTSLKEKGYF